MLPRSLLSAGLSTVLLWPMLPLASIVNADEATPTIRTQRDGEAITVYCDDAVVLRYNIRPVPAPKDEYKVYERSGYIHPIFSPAGNMVSGDYADDHPHQHGLFTAWTKTTYRGKKVDFWNQAKRSGEVHHDRVIHVGLDGFRVGIKHFGRDRDGTLTEILDDVWNVHVSRSTSGGRPVYVIKFAIAQTNISDDPLTIDEYHYGGIGFRGHNGWYSSDSADALNQFSKSGQSDEHFPPLDVTLHRFATSDGKRRFEGNHSRPNWTALYGKMGDRLSGIEVSDSPDNFRHPHPMRLHPNKPYFSISTCVLGEFVIAPGETYRAEYQFTVFDDAVPSAHLTSSPE